MSRQDTSTRSKRTPPLIFVAMLALVAMLLAGLGKSATAQEKSKVIDLFDPTWLGQAFTEEQLREQLARLPEILLEDIRPGEDPPETRAKILELVKKIEEKNKGDGFIRELRRRADMVGLPFMRYSTDDPSLPKAQAEQLHLYARAIREAVLATEKTVLIPVVPKPKPFQPKEDVGSESRREPDPRAFWLAWSAGAVKKAQERRDEAAKKDAKAAATMEARALAQLFASEAPEFRRGLVRYLQGVQDSSATALLVRQAMFAPERDVRRLAALALRERPKQEYTPLLLDGLRYPWAPAAHHAAQALLELRRTDLLPKLVELLEAPDPTEPVETSVGDKKVMRVREVVRINHHRNCLLCHAPGDREKDAVTGRVSVPGEALPAALGIEYYFANGSGAVFVRADVTYLHQDFSMMLPVKDHKEFAWPALQRFDFVARTRTLTEAEAAKARKEPKLAPSEHRQAILFALRRLSGNVEADDDSPRAWRFRLGLERPWRSPCLK